jgi:moderate conductance mechanosensitive channel
MSLTVRPLTDVALWVRGSGLEIVLIVTGTILLTRLATWLGARITGRIDATARETDALVRSEASKHRHALAQVITWATLAVISPARSPRAGRGRTCSPKPTPQSVMN